MEVLVRAKREKHGRSQVGGVYRTPQTNGSRLVQSGTRAEIVERVPIVLSDARQTKRAAQSPRATNHCHAPQAARQYAQCKIIDLLRQIRWVEPEAAG